MPTYIAGMTKKTEAPDRMDIRVPEELKQRLETIAKRENRSRNAQASYYIEMGLAGLDARLMAQEIAEIKAKLDAILRHLDKK